MTPIDTTAPSQTDAISFEFDLPHPPTKVWRALSEPALIAQWLLPIIDGQQMSLAPGRTFTLQTQPHPGWDGTVNCRFLEIEAEKKLSYTWIVGKMLNTVVTFTLTPTPTGTHLRMEQAGFRPGQEPAFKGATAAWRQFLMALEEVLARTG